MSPLRFLAIVAFVLGVGAVVSVVHPHDIYTDWKMPGSTTSCCSEKDCRPVRAMQDMDGNWTAFVEGREIRIPRDRILNIKSPDGRSHLCSVPNASVPYCFVPGEVRI